MNRQASDQLLGSILKDVSRSFYLTLRILPGGVRPQIGLAYLLARTTDTIADTDIVPAELRLQALRDFQRRVRGGPGARLELGSLARHQQSSAERTLLERAEDCLSALESFEDWDRQQVRAVLQTITSGQEQDLQHFDGASQNDIRALRTADELDDYTYKVAGCVGEFWTRMCCRHLFPEAPIDQERLLTKGVRFGKGLQLANILRDIPADLRIGRCYIPSEQLSQAGLVPRDLLEPAAIGKFRTLYAAWLDKAESHLRAGWDYTNSLPFCHARVRLACAWPLLIAFETLKLLRKDNVLDHTRRLKVSRAAVRGIVARSVMLYPLPARWSRMAS